MAQRKAQELAQLTALREAHVAAPRMLVLVGIPGSGKTTFAGEMQKAGWARVSQDDLGDRYKCERKTAELLLASQDVVIDRCNFDAAQRAHWVAYGKARGCTIGCVVFATPMGECVARVTNREAHPTIPPGKQSAHVVRRIANGFSFPDRGEMFDFCRVIRQPHEAPRVLRELLHAEDQ